jgi:hypothetical protein
MGEANDLENNISTCHWFVPTGSARIVSIAFFKIQAVNIRLQIVKEDFN